MAVTTSFLYDGESVLLEQQGRSTKASYAYGNALTRKDGETPLFDGLGSERTVTNAGGAVQATLTLTAFGMAVASSGSSTSAYQYAATSRYRNDGDAGLALVGCRYYDAQVGQFITRDTDLDEDPYAYCDGDPVDDTDPSGHGVVPPRKPGGPDILGPVLKKVLKVLDILDDFFPITSTTTTTTTTTGPTTTHGPDTYQHWPGGTTSFTVGPTTKKGPTTTITKTSTFTMGK